MSARDSIESARGLLKDALVDFLNIENFDGARDLLVTIEDLTRVLNKNVDALEIMGLNKVERDFVHAGMLLEAIKALRTRHGGPPMMGLKDAKDKVEAYREAKMDSHIDINGYRVWTVRG